jgi:hypothetical protein
VITVTTTMTNTIHLNTIYRMDDNEQIVAQVGER